MAPGVRGGCVCTDDGGSGDGLENLKVMGQLIGRFTAVVLFKSLSTRQVAQRP